MTSGVRCTARLRSGGSPLDDIEDMLPEDLEETDFNSINERKHIMATKKVAATETKKPEAKEEAEDNLVHLKTLAAEFDMDPRAVRIHLRAKGYTKPEGRWAWEEDSTDLVKLRKELQEKKDKPEPEEKEKAEPVKETVVKKKTK